MLSVPYVRVHLGHLSESRCVTGLLCVCSVYATHAATYDSNLVICFVIMSHRSTFVKKVVRPSGLVQPKTRMPTASGKVAGDCCWPTR